MIRLTPTLLAAAAGYLAGSIPSADIATRLARTKVDDLRAAGSGNPGALNAAAVLGRRWGAAVLGADMAKGAAAGVIGRAIAGPSGAYAAATASIAGHIVPVWSGGRGGKGVATSAGACAAVFPAYFPIDAAVAATAAVTARNAERTIWISSAAWVAAAVVWWRRGLSERLGTEPHRWAPTVRHRRRDDDPGQVPRRENPGMIAIVTDSASMLPASLRTRYGIVVVPITITIDGREYADGVDLAIGDFYERLTRGAVVTTAAPSPGAFVDAYRSAAAAGAEAVLSVHTGAAYSATVGSATVAAGLVDIPITIVDTEVASFPVALAVWSAAAALTRGASIADAAFVASQTARRAGSLFVVGVPEVARRGGRFVAVRGELTPTTVLRLADGAFEEYQTGDRHRRCRRRDGRRDAPHRRRAATACRRRPCRQPRRRRAAHRAPRRRARHRRRHDVRGRPVRRRPHRGRHVRCRLRTGRVTVRRRSGEATGRAGLRSVVPRAVVRVRRAGNDVAMVGIRPPPAHCRAARETPIHPWGMM